MHQKKALFRKVKSTRYNSQLGYAYDLDSKTAEVVGNGMQRYTICSDLCA